MNYSCIGLMISKYSFRIYIIRFYSSTSTTSQMDLNTMTTFRSLLLGVVNNKTSFLQNEDVTCFYHHHHSHNHHHSGGNDDSDSDNKQSSSSSSSSLVDKQHQQQKMANNKNVDVSQFKSINIDYLSASNFSFHPYHLNVNVNVEKSPKKSLLVLFAWLFAKERHLDKYRRLYMEQGFDILTIKVNVKDFIIPVVGSQVIASQALQFIKEHEQIYCSLVFHAFSVGAYQMGELLVMLNQEHNKEVKNIARKLLKGMIYDSAADINEAPIGLSKATTTNPLLQWAICSLLNAHFRFCYNLATRHYLASSDALHQNEFHCPSLVFLSKDDVVVNYVDQLKTAEQWQRRGISVTMKCWDQSPHVSHFFKHPDEYRSLLIEFLNKNVTGLIQQ
uniref:Transmembrane protein 53-A-like isoform X3 n=1 Tax=Dermatophagoides pteronyssinus TaxID=6956 RepID=A0A6P6YKA1_DERPT|nr:transmembrane protein 53-A-like isoform X3 [Dermatophagoides pteronyssinus]